MRTRLRLAPTAWKRRFPVVEVGAGGFSGLGVLMVFVDIANSFFPDWATAAGAWPSFLGVAGAGALVGAYRALPTTQHSARLAGRDTVIELIVGDIFDGEDAVVVPTNSTLETRLDALLSPKSVQGHVATKFYDSLDHLDLDLANAASRLAVQPTDSTAPAGRKTLAYPNGTVVAVKVKERRFYWLVMSRITAHGRAEGTPEEVLNALPMLWAFVADHGDKGSIAIPLLGTGFARSNLTRETMVKEIVRSFIAANAVKTFCDRLKIVIHPDDVVKYAIDVDHLAGFLRNACEHAEFRATGFPPVGTALP